MATLRKKLALWKHQTDAVRLGQRYLRAYHQGKTSGSALIRLPTGTGKTGVMAVLARLLYKSRSVLVLSPAAALRDQLAREIRDGFWCKINADVSDYPAEVIEFTPGSIDDILEKNKGKPCILVSTIQTLTKLHRDENYHDKLGKLAKRVDYVFFDEGHREPSGIWGDAVRHLEKPIILFSATPYRNDYAYFDIDDRYCYNEFSYQDAVNAHYIRRVEFEEIDFDPDPDAFVDSLLDYYDGRFKKIIHHNDQDHEPRVIIHCRTKNNVIAVAASLKRRCRSVVAVHEKLSSSEKYYRRDAPEPQKMDAIFWVHQYKLLEGIDDSSFQLLALYDGFKNALSLVQQIGRVIRNPGRRECQVAVVFTKPQDGQQTFWRRYEAYEERRSPYYNPRDLCKQALEQSPPIRYVEGNYRERFSIARDHVYLAFRYPCSANVFVPTQAIDLSDLKKKTVEEWKGKLDRDVGKVDCPDKNTVVIPYVTGQNAPVLLQDYFIELSLGFTIIRREGGYIFIYDSRGSVPKALQEVARSVDPGKVAHLFSGDNARAYNLSLLNSDIGARSIRRRTIYAYSIAETAPILADYVYFCSTLQGYVRDQRGGFVGRYIGFTRGRVTDRVRGLLDYRNYIKWIREVANSLSNSEIEPDALLDRYAGHVGTPEDTTPRHILLDLDDVIEAEAYKHVASRKPLYVEDLAMSVSGESFKLQANKAVYNVHIDFVPQTATYRLSSPKLDNAYVLSQGHGDRFQRGIIAHLNVTQSFRVVPEAEWTIYAHSKFYRPRRSFPELMNIFEPVAALRDVCSEKGESGSATKDGWHSESVFHVIDSRGRQPEQYEEDGLAEALSDMDILICDDMQNEVADFIAASRSEQRVALIHAKASDRRLSASAFQDVCGQAVKNLEILNPYLDWEPPNFSRWNKPWIESKQGQVPPRIRKGEGTALDLWNAIRDIIRNPAAAREVWIVYGKGFSLKTFREQQQSDDPRPEAIQLLYLLQSTWASVASIGARFRIFCPGESNTLAQSNPANSIHGKLVSSSQDLQ